MPELQRCFVYARRPPRLLSLNADAWAVLELSDGRDVGALERIYADLLEGSATAEACRTRFLDALEALRGSGLISIDDEGAADEGDAP